ncbi:MAG TPA: hypothetical protein VHD32_00115 [Candidatus Didemnitutus sp.]|nr:hypothetical protein [Candidatus Didemnitutus sp.]
MKPFLNGKKTLAVTPLRTVQSSSPLPAPTIVRPPPTGPTVETVKQGDKVMRLIVTCACGERIEIDCLYPAGS